MAICCLRSYSVLEERRIQVFIESIFKRHRAWHKADLVGEFDFGSGHQCFPSFGRQFNIHNTIAIVADFEFFVRKNVRFLISTVAANVAHTSPDWQTVNVHLIPVIIFNGICECLHLLFVQFNHANLNGCNVICRNINNNQ